MSVLFFPGSSSGVLASRWTAASMPQIAQVPGGAWINTEYLSDNKALPFYLLQPTLPTPGTIALSGNMRGQDRNWDVSFAQQFCYGVKLNAGDVPWAWAFPANPLAVSGTKSYTWVSGSAGVGIFIPFVYVWRPSTQSVVGYLWDGYTSTSSFANIQYSQFNAMYNSNSAVFEQWTGWPAASTGFYTNSTVAAQAGDFLVVEVWSAGYSGTGPVAGQEYNYSANWKVGGPIQNYNTSSSAAGSDNFCTFAYQDETKWVGGVSVGGMDAPTTVNLVSVTPKATQILELGFDARVGITGPTIGAATDGVGVTGVTQVSTTVVDLNLAIRPDHPVGQADTSTLVPPLGSAENLGPHVPTGVGAIVI
jgi:hypothetical protein